MGHHQPGLQTALLKALLCIPSKGVGLGKVSLKLALEEGGGECLVAMLTMDYFVSKQNGFLLMREGERRKEQSFCIKLKIFKRIFLTKPHIAGNHYLKSDKINLKAC